MRTLAAKFSNITNLKNYHLGKKKKQSQQAHLIFNKELQLPKVEETGWKKKTMLMPYSRQ